MIHSGGSKGSYGITHCNVDWVATEERMCGSSRRECVPTLTRSEKSFLILFNVVVRDVIIDHWSRGYPPVNKLSPKRR